MQKAGKSLSSGNASIALFSYRTRRLCTLVSSIWWNGTYLLHRDRRGEAWDLD